MRVTRGFAILTTPDLPALVDFYRAAFGAVQSYAFDTDGVPVYVSLEIGAASLGIGADDGPVSDVDRAALWFDVDDLDGVYSGALAAGARSVSAPADMPWGERVARVRDPAGFLISLGEPSASTPASAAATG